MHGWEALNRAGSVVIAGTAKQTRGGGAALLGHRAQVPRLLRRPQNGLLATTTLLSLRGRAAAEANLV